MEFVMNRITVAQACLDRRNSRVYLEIGVSYGAAFRRITADQKIGVDPKFAMGNRARRQAESRAKRTHYFEMTSDEFFSEESEFLAKTGVDVALIDGFHTHSQSLRDVESTLRYLRDGGVIVMHDCSPISSSSASPAASYADFRRNHHWWEWAWSGDVWKAIVHLRSTRTDVKVAVLNCDFGVGLIRKGLPESTLSFSPEEIGSMSYEALRENRKHLLNLRAPDYLEEFLRDARPLCEGSTRYG